MHNSVLTLFIANELTIVEKLRLVKETKMPTNRDYFHLSHLNGYDSYKLGMHLLSIWSESQINNYINVVRLRKI